ncbi:MAG: class I SAM-dependent methyltransferase [Chthoniobacterales bacterium]
MLPAVSNPSDVSHGEAAARVAARFSSRPLRGYVAHKLRSDSVFQLAYKLLRESSRPILDVGCGVGLLALYLRERGLGQAITGVDIDQRKIERGRAAVAAGGYQDVQLLHGNVIADVPSARGDIVLFDVLHYLPDGEQTAILAELAQRVTPGGMLLLRDCTNDGSARFQATYVAERFAQAVAWNWRTPLNFPTFESISSAFDEAEFTREIRTAWDRTPFNNRLFIFRREQSPTARLSG